MNFSFSTIINLTIVSCILTAILGLLMRRSRMLTHFGTPLLLGITFLLILRFFIPVEFTFTHSVYIYDVYPPVYHFFTDALPLPGKQHISIANILFGIWIAVSCILVLRSILQYVQFMHLFSSCHRIEDYTISQIMHRLQSESGKQKHFCIVECPAIKSPMIFGITHPYILLPPIQLSEEYWYFILKHELTHYYRGHLILKLLCQLLCDLYWWNPAVYLLRRFMNLLLEMDADTNVTKALSKEDRQHYLYCLSEISRLQIHRDFPQEWSVTFVSAPKTYLGRRSHYLLTNLEPHRKNFYIPALILSVVCGVFWLLSIFIIFEPSSRPSDLKMDEMGNAIFDFNENGCFLLKNQSGTYTIYIDWKKNTEINTLPDDRAFDNGDNIYTTLKEAYQNEF